MLFLSAALVALSAARAPGAQGKGYDMDYGPFLCYTIGQVASTNAPVVAKGIAIHVGANAEAAVCFDSALVRYAAGWTGGFLDISKTHLTSAKGSLHAVIDGDVQFETPPLPGWRHGQYFSDPRPFKAGPLPRDWAHYRGLYRYGDQVVLHYAVGSTLVWETPGYETNADWKAFTRKFHVNAGESLTLLVSAWTGEAMAVGTGPGIETSETGGDLVVSGERPLRAAAVVGLPRGKHWRASEGRLELELPASATGFDFEVMVLRGGKREGGWEAALRRFIKEHASVRDPRELCHGGPPLWSQSIAAKGMRGFGRDAYVVDTLTVPEKNPWNSWMRLAALDFFPDGRAAVSTWSGDVWIVSGIDDSLQHLAWKRFAAGLFEGLGLKIVDGDIYVVERSQITRLRDLNQDGEADYYENFNNDAPTGPSYHAFAFGLDTDSEGNFYYTRCGHRVDTRWPLNGGMIKISKDGRHSELFASGLRAPNGMSIGPEDQITCSDNQGNWTPSSRINLVHEGGFYGYVPHAHRAEVPHDYDPPICWIPYPLDNSSGGQVWVTGGKWGPLEGHLLHTSYGKGTLFEVLMETVDGQAQGGAVQFPLRFNTGIMRGRFNPVDGQLYLCGLKGWQTVGFRDGGLQRVRYTGAPVRLPIGLHVAPTRIEVTFAVPLDPESATDIQNYAISQWTYHWTADYGSPEFSAAHPDEKGHDEVELKKASLSADGRSVYLEVEPLHPVMQMEIKYRIHSAGGALLANSIYNTINRLPAGHE